MRLFRSLLPVCLFLVALPLAAQNLEIHYIDVGWGGSVFIKGPTGITVLMEAGNTGMGTQYVVPYLQSIGVQPANGIDYVIGGHQHCDHIGGLDEVINAGYNIQCSWSEFAEEYRALQQALQFAEDFAERQIDLGNLLWVRD